MTAGPLHPDNLPAGRDRILGKGHGTDALGPSDSSDSGSDVKGAGSEVGGVNLDSDSDRFGTGEVASSDTAVRDGADIDTDHIETIPAPDFEDEDLARKRPRH